MESDPHPWPARFRSTSGVPPESSGERSPETAGPIARNITDAEFRVLSRNPDPVAWPSHHGVIKMKILCAWCCREGQPGYLGEREPLENPQATHGICAHHKTQFLESLPSRSFSDAELLIVVRRNSPALYERLKQSFAAMPAVKVTLDCRGGTDPYAATARSTNAGARSVRLGHQISELARARALASPLEVRRELPRHLAQSLA
jgi:hypothetical protein